MIRSRKRCATLPHGPSARSAAWLFSGLVALTMACDGSLEQSEDPVPDGAIDGTQAADTAHDGPLGPRPDAADPDAALSDQGRRPDVGAADVGPDLAPTDAGSDPDAAVEPDARPPEPCRTRISYGNTWIAPGNHPARHDEVAGVVTWDGTCGYDGQSSFAQLSNGWRPFFRGRAGCLMALDVRGDCAEAQPACRTRITYGANWERAPNHPNDFDEVAGVVTWDGACANAGGLNRATLSNGWAPHFRGACDISIRNTQCGGLYTNPVVPQDCPDPGVARTDDGYVMACTGGNAPDGFPIRTSPDLVTWSRPVRAFPNGTRPAWAASDLWAPEIHRLDDRWALYYSARNRADGSLALGVAFADTPTGPYVDLGRPLLHDPNPGVIDTHFFQAPDGTRYLTWKRDGNAVRQPTPIFIQQVAADGHTLQGQRTEILRNTLGWEGGLVEGQWIIHHAGRYYLFYSANGYATPRYAVGVARSDSPTGPYQKRGDPILTSNATFAGPGHGSILRGPSGDWIHVYHAWSAGRVGEAPGRQVLVDRIDWRDGWPHFDSRPSPRSVPPP